MLSRRTVTALKWTAELVAANGQKRGIVLAVLVLGSGFLEYIEPILFGQAVQAVAQAEAGEVMQIAVLWLGLGLVLTISSAITTLLSTDLGYRMRTDAWVQFLVGAAASSDKPTSTSHSGSMIRTGLNGTSALLALWGAICHAHGPAVLGLVTLIPLAFWMNAWLALALLLVAFCAVLLLVTTLRTSYAAQEEGENKYGEAAARVTDVLRNLPVFQAYGAIPNEKVTLRRLLTEFRVKQFWITKRWAWSAGTSRVLASGSMIGMLLLGSMLHARGEASLAEIVAFVGFAGFVTARLEMLVHFGQQLNTFLPAIAELASYCSRSTRPDQPLDGSTQLENDELTCRLELRDVWFAYPDAAPTLKGVSFQVNSGETVALVGESGAGKSTILALILGLLKPSKGQVLLNGATLEQVGEEEWRRKIGVVFQDAMILNRSVGENIGIALSQPQSDAIREIATKVGADDMIQRLPQGYESIVAEGGTSLSGGERQRIALARALIRSPSILLLDEPTTAIHPRGARELWDVLRATSARRATLLVAHYDSLVSQADRVVVLEDGTTRDGGNGSEYSQRRDGVASLVDADA